MMNLKHTLFKNIAAFFKKSGLWCFIIFILFVSSTQATEMPRMFLEGIQYYKADDFPRAISAFLKIAETGVRNSKLFYNLGNAYLKNGDLGNAMLWYERALKLTPDDPDLKFNYEHALSQIKDAREEKEISIFRILFFWKHIFSVKTVQGTAITLNVIFWLIVILQIILKKKILRTSVYLIFIFAIIFTATAFYNYYEAAYIRHGIILPSQVSVRSGLTDESTELFVLHAGTKVKIEKENKAFFRIYFSEGKIGWIRQSQAGVI
ncbi:tetratricopeptide repeat protein [Desulfonema magnum]|uniref:Tetratricopeptide repeat-containing protein n=1 Tax=Desulfonema magnum TaxID=45655 RepID=A0A975BPQ3_9BACT|nr:tetratricopeptide repeat protein [Desulfonema magnum]QTA88795.1 Tetratricopeptide repeat-containing protein [Desulfonema magnum]